MADEKTGHKTFRYQLLPTPAQERVLERTLMRCRHVYNAAIGERREAWHMRGVTVTYYQQKAELPGIKEAMPECAEVHSQVLQDVIWRVERAYQAFFRRMREGEQPGYPRFQGRTRYHSFTYLQYGNGAVLDGGVLSLSKIGRVRVRLHRPIEGTPKTVTLCHQAGGWYACFSCAEVPVQSLPRTGRETGIDVGLKAFLVTADGVFVENPRYRRSGTWPSAISASRGARRGVNAAPKRSRSWRRHTRRCGASGRTSTIRRRSPSCARTTPSTSKTSRSAI
jgi:putative transposase